MSNNYIKLFGVLVVMVPVWLVVPGCMPNQQDTEKPNKTILKYTLSKLDAAKTHKFAAPNEIRGIVTSGDGEWLYVVGKDKASLRSLGIENRVWGDALGDFKGLKKAADRSAVADLSGHAINGFSASKDGMLLTLKDLGLVVLRGTGVDNASYYEHEKHFPKGSFSPVQVNKGADSFIYLFDQDKARKGVSFRAYVEPPKLDTGSFDNSLKKSRVPMAHLDHVFWARTQDHKGNLLLADAEGIKRLLAEDIGAKKQVLDNEGKPIISADKLMLDHKTKNDHINALAMVDDRHLVIGLKSFGPHNGGIVVTDLLAKKATFRTTGAGLTVRTIATERIRHPEKTRIGAIVTTDKGLILLDNRGDTMELVPGAGALITSEYITKHRIETKDYDKAQNGFSGDTIADPGKKGFRGAAQDKNGQWYLAFPHDIYTLDIVTEQVEAPKVVPVLPSVP